jgi:transposase InsO family protein
MIDRDAPENVRSDNGPEFTSRRMIGWAEEKKLTLSTSNPAGYAERYDCKRPQSGLNYKTPEEFRRFLHGGCATISQSNLNRESPVMNG